MTPPLTPQEQRVQAPHDQAVHEALRRLDLPAKQLTQTASSTVSVTPRLTPQEQRIVSLAVAVPRSDGRDRAPPRPHLPLPTQALSQLGARVDVLADGTVVATMLPSASASDQAFLAVRCALVLEEQLPDVDVAVATGRGRMQGQLPIGEAIDRVFELLKGSAHVQSHQAPRGVWVDVLTEDLLAGRLRIERENGRARAVREQDPEADENVRRLLGQPTPCVGREQELATLESILSTCIGDSVARAAIVVAPPGWASPACATNSCVGWHTVTRSCWCSSAAPRS